MSSFIASTLQVAKSYSIIQSPRLKENETGRLILDSTKFPEEPIDLDFTFEGKWFDGRDVTETIILFPYIIAMFQEIKGVRGFRKETYRAIHPTEPYIQQFEIKEENGISASQRNYSLDHYSKYIVDNYNKICSSFFVDQSHEKTKAILTSLEELYDHPQVEYAENIASKVLGLNTFRSNMN